MLGQYRRAFDEKNGVYHNKPIERHQSKHGSDAFRYLAVSYKLAMEREKPKPKTQVA